MSATPAYILLGASEASLKELSQTLFGSTPEPKLFLFPGDPRPSLEPLPSLLQKENIELARIISLVDLSVLEKNKSHLPWFELLAHFSDVLLLSNAKLVSPAWLTSLKKTLRDRPLEIIDWPPKKNISSLLEDILTPVPRRLTQYFDESPTIDLPVYQSDDEDSDEEFENRTAAEIKADEEDAQPEEAYFARDMAKRYRIKILAP